MTDPTTTPDAPVLDYHIGAQLTSETSTTSFSCGCANVSTIERSAPSPTDDPGETFYIVKINGNVVAGITDLSAARDLARDASAYSNCSYAHAVEHYVHAEGAPGIDYPGI